eukprot:m.51422 g.51422  ORF g.51422 m.51422 type:complete len:1630 (+) comp12223_c0_seq4:378-5267(+)
MSDSPAPGSPSLSAASSAASSPGGSANRRKKSKDEGGSRTSLFGTGSRKKKLSAPSPPKFLGTPQPTSALRTGYLMRQMAKSTKSAVLGWYVLRREPSLAIDEYHGKTCVDTLELKDARVVPMTFGVFEVKNPRKSWRLHAESGDVDVAKDWVFTLQLAITSPESLVTVDGGVSKFQDPSEFFEGEETSSAVRQRLDCELVELADKLYEQFSDDSNAKVTEHASAHMRRILYGRTRPSDKVPRLAVRVLVSSTFVDSVAERNWLAAFVSPVVQRWCSRLNPNFQFDMVDLRWGITNKVNELNQTVQFCLDEVERCRAVSLGMFFLSLQGQRYGTRPLPTAIESFRFKAMLTALKDDADALATFEEWYKQDENATPALHVLQPPADVLGLDWRESGCEEDLELAHSLMSQVFRRLAPRCFAADVAHKLTRSITEAEADTAMLSAPQDARRCLWLKRTIVDLGEHAKDAARLGYADCRPGAVLEEERAVGGEGEAAGDEGGGAGTTTASDRKLLDPEAHKLRQALHGSMRRVLQDSNCVRMYKVRWAKGHGIDEYDPAHARYLAQACLDTTRALLSSIGLAYNSFDRRLLRLAEPAAHLAYARGCLAAAQETSSLASARSGSTSVPSSSDAAGPSGSGASAPSSASASSLSPGVGAGASPSGDLDTEAVNAVRAYLSGRSCTPFVLTAEVGGGLTHAAAWTASFVQAGGQAWPAPALVVRHVGATPTSVRPTSLMHSISLQLNKLYDTFAGLADGCGDGSATNEAKSGTDKANTTGDPTSSNTTATATTTSSSSSSSSPPQPAARLGSVEHFVGEFHMALSRATAERPVVLVLDGLDQLEAKHGMWWLPSELPVGVKIVLTVHEGTPCLDHLTARLPATAFVSLPRPSEAAVRGMVQAALTRAGRRLTAAQEKVLFARLANAGYALGYTRCALDVALRWRSWDAPELGATVEDIVGANLERLVVRHGMLAYRALGLLVACCAGLTHRELAAALNADEAVLSEVFQHWRSVDGKVPPVLVKRLIEELGEYITHSIDSVTGDSLLCLRTGIRAVARGLFDETMLESSRYCLATQWTSVIDNKQLPVEAVRRAAINLPPLLLDMAELTQLRDVLLDIRVAYILHKAYYEDGQFGVLTYWGSLNEDPWDLAPMYMTNLRACITSADREKSAARKTPAAGSAGEEQSSMSCFSEVAMAALAHARLTRTQQQVADFHFAVADLLILNGAFDEAVEPLNACLAIQTHVLGEQHADTALTCNALGICHLESGRPAEALQWFERSLAIKREVSPGSEAMAATLSNIAIIRRRQGELDTALTLLDEAETLLRSARVPVLWRLGATLTNRGVLLKNRGDYDGALAAYQEALTTKREGIGASAPSVATTLVDLANLTNDRIHRDLGLISDHDGSLQSLAEDDTARRAQLQEALDQLQQAEDVRTLHFGAEHTSLNTVHGVRGSILATLGDLDAARVSLRRALDLLKDDPEMPHHNRHSILVTLAFACDDGTERIEHLLAAQAAAKLSGEYRAPDKDAMVRIAHGLAAAGVEVERHGAVDEEGAVVEPEVEGERELTLQPEQADPQAAKVEEIATGDAAADAVAADVVEIGNEAEPSDSVVSEPLAGRTGMQFDDPLAEPDTDC